MIAIRRPGLSGIGIVAAAGGVGLAAAAAPLLAALGTLGVLVALWILALGDRVRGVFLGATAAILVGYAFLGRSFAYVGVPPLFVGEAVMALGCLAFLHALGRWQLTRVHGALLLFMAWSALQTIPYLPRDGVDALRDGVTWLYGTFALLVATIVLPARIPRAVRLYRRLVPWLLAWIPVAGLVGSAFGTTMPRIPGSDVPLLAFKGGDAGVQLAGIAGFILVGLYARAEPKPRLPEPVPWLLWLGGAAVVSIVNRGGMIAAASAALALAFVRQSSRVTSLLFIVALIMVLGLLVNPRFDIGARREFSFQQVTENVVSVFITSDDALEGTKGFRLRWWETIVDYTVHGPYFWTGKGYGIALGEADGFNTTEAEDLRSPHNGHIEILARSGVPGLALWVLLLAVFAASMASAAARARADGRHFWVQVIAWIAVFWTAALVNASFDPYLQGPQGGIWFWVLTGLGMAAVRAVREGEPDPWARDEDDGTPRGRGWGRRRGDRRVRPAGLPRRRGVRAVPGSMA